MCLNPFLKDYLCDQKGQEVGRKVKWGVCKIQSCMVNSVDVCRYQTLQYQAGMEEVKCTLLPWLSSCWYSAELLVLRDMPVPSHCYIGKLLSTCCRYCLALQTASYRMWWNPNWKSNLAMISFICCWISCDHRLCTLVVRLVTSENSSHC